MRSIKYDSTIIQTFARRLYDQAFVTILSYALAGAAVVGSAAAVVTHMKYNAVGWGDVFMFAAGGALIGLLVGRQRAFSLKLQAQTALCQVQIEANTRNLAYVVGTPVSPPVRPAIDVAVPTVRAESA